MSDFDPSWLTLREPYDHAVRDQTLSRAFAAALGPSPEVIDLGAGTGSNLRCLAPFLPPSQRWVCVDYDPVLLECLEAMKPAGTHVTTQCLDLADGLDALSIPKGAGVTAAALLDLVSEDWLRHLMERCRDRPLLMTLSFDGRMIWDPVDPADDDIGDAFCRHQRSDKGFGPALGPDAALVFADLLKGAGREVRQARSDWVFGHGDAPILRAMVEGIAEAAGEIDPGLPFAAWRERRLRDAGAGMLSLTVGHLDVLALP